SYDVDHPIVGDARIVLEQMIEAVRDRLRRSDAPRLSPRERIATLRTRWLDVWMPQLTWNETPLSAYRVIWDFIRTIDPDTAIVTHDAGSPRDQLVPFYVATRPHGYIGWGKSHQLGSGLGLIMGAKLAEPAKLCVNWMGDAAFGMTGLDVETAVRSSLPTLTIVLKNSTMAIERNSLTVSHDRYRSRDLGGDYCAIARALGAYAETVETPDQIVPAIERARAHTEAGRAALLEFITSTESALSNLRGLG
ncbi:MAG TPA: thiamine pyrophosphate-dependent enzyme, partial [Candidatus Limnocylindria bacterium]|nr:thiamine pyrophosphate-dependent enzyme [Candidatus Limnocylindria bacterium]